MSIVCGFIEMQDEHCPILLQIRSRPRTRHRTSSARLRALRCNRVRAIQRICRFRRVHFEVLVEVAAGRAEGTTAKIGTLAPMELAAFIVSLLEAATGLAAGCCVNREKDDCIADGAIVGCSVA